MATALSIDHWSAPASSKCLCESSPELSVNFICAHPQLPNHRGTHHPTTRRPKEPPDKPTAARFQEAFVDLIGLHCAVLDAESRHVLDERFDSFLGSGERDFKDALMRLMSAGFTEDAKSTPAYRELEKTLRSKMGYRNPYSWINSHKRDSSETGVATVTGLLSELMMPDKAAETSQMKGEDNDKEREFSMVQQIADAIRAEPNVWRWLALGGDTCEEILRPILQDILSEEDVDLFVSVVNNPSPGKDFKVLRSLLRPPGHVFVANTSVCDLFCDAFLCPGAIGRRNDSLNGSIFRQWFRKTLEPNIKLKSHIWPIKFKRYNDYDRVVTHQHWPWDEFRENAMAPVPFLVGGEVSLEKSRLGRTYRRRKKKLPPEQEHIESLMETVRQFLTVALSELRSHQPRPLAGRERYLLAVPVLGTGGGFAGDLTGQLVEQLLKMLSECALREDDVDMVLTCIDEATYAHAQTIRYKAVYEQDANKKTDASSVPAALSMFPTFGLMTAEMQENARQLAELASSGHMALFLGAGVSIGSGLPGWFSLLHNIEDLFTQSGKPQERKLGNAAKWDPLLMATWLHGMCTSRIDRNGVKETLKKRICNFITDNGKYPGLLLSLLVSLPCNSVVTQNYDRLIERAFECWNVGDQLSSKALSVIPYSPQRDAHHWLLKMHGCVSMPEEIVITGDDYKHFDNSRYKALKGLVQASLLTKHLLFVGFSLTDPNYLNIVDQVRNALCFDFSSNNGNGHRPSPIKNKSFTT